MMENLEKLVEMADDEFGAIAKNGKFKSREEIHSAYELMDLVKDAYCIWQYEDEMESGEDGMSSAGGSYYREGRGGQGGGNRGGGNRGGGYNRGRYEEGGAYERRGRGRNARRDSMGRYAEGGMMRRGGGYGNYSAYRDGGKEEFAENLREMMQEAPDEQTRMGIQQMLQNMGQG